MQGLHDQSQGQIAILLALRWKNALVKFTKVRIASMILGTARKTISTFHLTSPGAAVRLLFTLTANFAALTANLAATVSPVTSAISVAARATVTVGVIAAPTPAASMPAAAIAPAAAVSTAAAIAPAIAPAAAVTAAAAAMPGTWCCTATLAALGCAC